LDRALINSFAFLSSPASWRWWRSPC